MARTCKVMVHFSEGELVLLDKLIDDGFSPNRSECLRKLVDVETTKRAREKKAVKNVQTIHTVDGVYIDGVWFSKHEGTAEGMTPLEKRVLNGSRG